MSGPTEAQKREAEAMRREEEAMKIIQLRKSIINKVCGFYGLPKPASGEGSMGKAAHLAGLTPEGVAMELLMDLLIFAFELLLNVPHKVQQIQFDAALKKELEMLKEGTQVQLVYREGMDIYGEDGKKIVGRKPTRNEIRFNGLIPKPKFKEGLLIAYDKHLERLYGPSSLSDAQKMRIRGVIDAADNASKKDLASDLLASKRPVAKK